MICSVSVKAEEKKNIFLARDTFILSLNRYYNITASARLVRKLTIE